MDLDDVTKLYFNQVENHIYVGKTDTSLNSWDWYKYIGNANCYHIPYKIIATSDGGCMITASVYDFVNSPNYQHDVYIIKLDGNGGITHVTNLTNNTGKSVSVYPVPAQQEIFLSYSGSKPFDFLMYDMAGRLVSQHKSLNRNNEKIFIGNLPAGHYVYQIKFNDGRRETGKLIKE